VAMILIIHLMEVNVKRSLIGGGERE